jgi:aminoacrylate peracid reductase
MNFRNRRILIPPTKFARFRAARNTVMPKQILRPPGSPPPIAPFSPGTKAGNVVYTSGLLPLDKDGKVIGVGDIKAQTRAVFENIKAVLAEGGATFADVTYSQVFITDLANFAAMNEVYSEYFHNDPPARYCIRCDLVKPEFLVEIACIAHL